MTGLRFTPIDTLFFRDGTPFSQGSAPQDGVGSLFPPHPPTIAGAVRAVLARCNGWDGRGRWPFPVTDVLGDGPDDLGQLSLTGPFLIRDRQPLFRAPRHLLGVNDGSGGWTPQAFLRPGVEVTCDLGDAVRLPELLEPNDLAGSDIDVHALKTSVRQWLTQAGMQAVLRGEIPLATDVVSSGDLWCDEPRIGLERNRTTRTAEEGMLYSTHHVRPNRGVSLGVRVAGIPGNWKLPFGRMVPFGGESRLAECEEWETTLNLTPPWTAIESNRRAALIALSPLALSPAEYCGRQELDIPGGPRVVSACLDRMQRIGGWDSLACRPLPLRSVLPSGSVLFCEVAEPLRLRDAVATSDGLLRIGAWQSWGFGAVALGAWPESSEVNT